jgi:hypothetical protein
MKQGVIARSNKTSYVLMPSSAINTQKSGSSFFQPQIKPLQSIADIRLSTFS